MINYSISLRANPSDQDAPKKAYANAQYSEIMTLDKFAEHISTHGSKYNRADIQAVLIQAVDCMREQLLAGQRIQMGDLGTFSIHINSMGAESLETYNPAIHVEDLNVRWKAGTRFLSLLKDSVFNLVPTRKAAKLVVKALKAGKNKDIFFEPDTFLDGLDDIILHNFLISLVQRYDISEMKLAFDEIFKLSLLSPFQSAEESEEYAFFNIESSLLGI